ncbi:MAG: hypothetical protein Q7U04_17660, partial [Bacteriovorax sp.]|nr:hypothetical protein [Bacteriovorax sp.]
MFIKRIHKLIFVIFIVSSNLFSKDLISLEGIVDSFDEKIVKLRTPKEDIVLNLNQLDQKTK